MTVYDILNSKIISSYGNDFQDIFYDIYKHLYGEDFEMPSPYGNVGDYKCDGILKSEETYFALYGPTNPNDSKAEYLCNKIESDIEGLINNINKGIWSTPLKKFVFLVNFKYESKIPAPLLSKADQLHSKHPNIKIIVKTNYDLLKDAFKLSSEDIQFILDKSYIKEGEIVLDTSVLSRLVEYFRKNKIEKQTIHNIMEFKDKLIFNHLSNSNCDILLHASFQITDLENYLNYIDPNALNVMQESVVELYKESLLSYPSDENSQLDYIVNNLKNKIDINDHSETKVVQSTCYVVVAKFFENCTVFKRATS